MTSTGISHPRPDAGRRDRDAHLDNVKAVLIALVVVGHTVGQTFGSYPAAATVYTWIYFFHMPAFVVLCGLLTTGRPLDGHRSQALVRTLVVPYVVFQVMYSLYYEVWGHAQNWGVDRLLTPVYHLWFLPALFIWRMLAPLWTRLRFALPIAVAVSLLAGTMTVFGPALALDRAMGLLPFFVFGMLYGKGTLAWLASARRIKVVAGLVLIAALPAAASVHANLDVPWLYWNASYHELHVGLVQGMAIRSGLLVLAMALACATFALVPRTRSPLTGVGGASMSPYLFHPFFTLAFAWSPYGPTRWWEIAGLCAAAVTLTAVLGSSWVSRAVDVVINPRVAWLFRPDTSSTDASRTRRAAGDGRSADAIAATNPRRRDVLARVIQRSVAEGSLSSRRAPDVAQGRDDRTRRGAVTAGDDVSFDTVRIPAIGSAER